MSRSRSLDTYRRKRDPARTPEPFGEPAAAAPEAVRRFVVQQHAARRLHWDFRLEIDGVLASWAVPKGPSVDPKEKRLAVQTEDHPLDYGGFEGVIPAGNYGAGAVILWDRGTYETVDGEDPAAGLERGKLDLRLSGHKLRGRWALVRIKRGSGKDWLLIKKADGTPTRPEPVAARPASVLSGLTVEELRDGARRDAELAAEAARAGAPRRPLREADLAPMLAGTAEQAFSRPGWLFELKYDGIRALAVRRAGGPVRLLSRRRRDIGASFPEIAAAAGHLPCDDFVVDGEIVAIDEGGAGSFERLQQRLGLSEPAAVQRAALEVPVLMHGFDLLAVAGHDLRSLPLATRKRLLRRLLPAHGVVRYADHIEQEGAGLFEAARGHHLEGIIAKRAASPYKSGRRSTDWLKIKVPRSARLAVVGYLPGKGSRRDLGALMLAWRTNGHLTYAGNVGSGFSAATVNRVLPLLRGARRDAASFEAAPDAVARNAVFVEPRLTAEVRYTETTARGLLRQPVLLAVHEDGDLSACDAPPKPVAPSPHRKGRASRREATPAPPSRLQLTNLDKVFWPGEGYTKGNLIAYYESVWPALQPYLEDRPLVLTRYPDGIEGKSFFQKNAPEFIPDWISTSRIDDTEYFVCNDRDSLLYVINLGCIPLHMWSARRAAIEHPDWTILDLDPKGAPFSHVVDVARHIHSLLAPLHAPHFVKTSGQDGLHILLPLAATLTHDEAKSLAEVIARVTAAELPEIATVARPLGDRGGKVYVDFLQNGRGKTIAAPFSARPRPGAPVSMPLPWRDVNARLDPARFTIRTAPARLRRRADPMRAVLETPVDVAAVLDALSRRMK
jgi:bifunctional non-homologous end joining protein LigD